MSTYEVSVLRKDQSTAVVQWMELRNPRALWPMVSEIAWNVGEEGGQIRVSDRNGEVVILTGVTSARLGFSPCNEWTSRRPRSLSDRAA